MRQFVCLIIMYLYLVFIKTYVSFFLFLHFRGRKFLWWWKLRQCHVTERLGRGLGGRRQGTVAVAFDVGPSSASPPLPAYKRQYTHPTARQRATVPNYQCITGCFILFPQSMSNVFLQLELDFKKINKSQILQMLDMLGNISALIMSG